MLILAMFNSTIRILFKNQEGSCCSYNDSQSFTSMDEVTLSTLGLFAVPQYRFLGSHKAFSELPVMQGTHRVSSYYKNLRATKFRLPPYLYKVTSTSFSNKAITLNTFPVLVLKTKAKNKPIKSFAVISPSLLSVNILTPSSAKLK